MTELKELTDAWKVAKRNEEEWSAHRIAIESQIYEAVSEQLPDKGTTTLDTGMKIVTGWSEDWDQEKLNTAYQNWSGTETPVAFPFIGVWKPDGKAISYLRDNAPTLFAIIQPCLTIKPRKPSFTMKSE